MKTLLVIVAMVMCLAMVAPASARDYSKMSNDELYQTKQQGIPVQDRATFETVWEMRVIQMNDAELQKYQIPYSKQEIEWKRQQYRNPEQGAAPLPPSGRR